MIPNPPTQAYCQKTPKSTPILISLPSPTSPPSSESTSCQKETLNLLGHPMPPTLLPSFFRVAHCKDRVADSALLRLLPLAQSCFNNVGMLCKLDCGSSGHQRDVCYNCNVGTFAEEMAERRGREMQSPPFLLPCHDVSVVAYLPQSNRPGLPGQKYQLDHFSRHVGPRGNTSAREP